jgi:asparagine synthase (glutamine-hydrolysing)
MRSPSFQSRPYWDAEAVAAAFRVACVGGSEESLFFWRAVNVELWLRVYFEGAPHGTAAQAGSGFTAHGDRRAAEAVGAAGLVATAHPNPGRHLIIRRHGETWARIPLRAELVRTRDDLGAALGAALDAAGAGGVSLVPGDVLAMSEKVVAITQGRSYPMDEIAVSPLARLLSRFVRRVPIGIGLGRPQTMQLALEEAGAVRVLLAAGCAAVTRPLGVRGIFYRVAGSRVSAIDGPTAYTIPPYNTHASKAPRDPDGVAERMRRALSDRAGTDIGVAVVDTNDLAADVLGASLSVDRGAVAEVLVDNPMGQTGEQTPFCILRRLA